MKKILLIIICNIILQNVGIAQWQQVNYGLYSGEILNFTVDPTTNYVFAGTSDGVFLSTNNGSNWTPVNYGLGGNSSYYNGIPVASIAISGCNIFAGTWGDGVYLSTNNGSSWTEVNNGMSGKSKVSSILISGNNIFAGTNEGVFLTTNNGFIWTAKIMD